MTYTLSIHKHIHMTNPEGKEHVHKNICLWREVQHNMSPDSLPEMKEELSSRTKAWREANDDRSITGRIVAVTNV